MTAKNYKNRMTVVTAVSMLLAISLPQSVMAQGTGAGSSGTGSAGSSTGTGSTGSGVGTGTGAGNGTGSGTGSNPGGSSSTNSTGSNGSSASESGITGGPGEPNIGMSGGQTTNGSNSQSQSNSGNVGSGQTGTSNSSDGMSGQSNSNGNGNGVSGSMNGQMSSGRSNGRSIASESTPQGAGLRSRAPSEPSVYNLGAAIQSTIDSSSDLAIAQKNLNRDEALVSVQKDRNNPRLNTSGTYTRLDSPISIPFNGTKIIVQPVNTEAFDAAGTLPLDISGQVRAATQAGSAASFGGSLRPGPN